MRAFLGSLLVLAAAVTLGAKSNLLRQITHAQYVYVCNADGYDETSFRTPPEDRDAILAVQDTIRKWHRYYLALDPTQADLLIVVRSGHLAAATVGGTIPRRTDTVPLAGTPTISIGSKPRPEGSPPEPPRGAPTVGVEGGPPDDMLSIYDGRLGHGLDAPPLWRKTKKDGLKSFQGKFEPPLLKEFRDEVDKADKEDAEKAAAKKKP